jgi:hypothetical protein
MKVDFVSFFVAKLTMEFKLFNGQNITYIHYNFGFTIINLQVYVIIFSKTQIHSNRIRITKIMRLRNTMSIQPILPPPPI